VNARRPPSFAQCALVRRGINVTGKNKLLMAELAAIVVQAGCGNVRTYIQSGNMVFRAKTLVARTAGGHGVLPCYCATGFAHKNGTHWSWSPSSKHDNASALTHSPRAHASSNGDSPLSGSWEQIVRTKAQSGRRPGQRQRRRPEARTACRQRRPDRDACAATGQRSHRRDSRRHVRGGQGPTWRTTRLDVRPGCV